MAVNLKFVQTPAIALYTGLSAAGTSMVVTPYPVDLDGVKLTMSDFGTNPTVTVDPKVSGFEEIAGFTGITDNGDNTATLTGLTRDLQSKYPYTGSGTGKLHGSSAVVVFSDNPQLFGRLAGKDNDETITGQWTFLFFPITPATPLATVVVYGMSRLSVAPVSALAPIALGDNDPRIPQNVYANDSGSANTYAITLGTPPASYVAGQLYLFKAANANTGASTLNVNSLGAKSLKTPSGATLLSGYIAAGQVVLVEYDGTNFQVMSVAANAATPIFGGTGADGALAVSSGITNIDAGGAQFVIKNYSSIAITGTGAIKFINPHPNGTTILIKCSGPDTLTSSATPMIDCSAMGAAGGTAVASGSSSASTISGNTGTVGKGFGPFNTNAGVGATTSAGTAGAVPTALTINSFMFSSWLSVYKYGLFFWLGAGGGSGSAYNNTGGALVLTSGVGGIGGGCLIMECAGAWNFTTANGISVAGAVGGAATGSGTTNGIAGGGGGGAGGFFLAIYNTLISNSGTVNVAGGTPGANTAGTGNAGAGGGGANAVTAGSSTTGAAGLAVAFKNTEFF